MIGDGNREMDQLTSSRLGQGVPPTVPIYTFRHGGLLFGGLSPQGPPANFAYRHFSLILSFLSPAVIAGAQKFTMFVCQLKRSLIKKLMYKSFFK
jgi:hypothetical protein